MGVALHIPEDILGISPLAKWGVEFVSFFAPTSRYAEKSVFPQVTSMYYTYAWLGAPLFMMWLYEAVRCRARAFGSHFKDFLSLPVEQWRFRDAIQAVVLLSVLLFCYWFLWGIYEGQNVRYLRIADSRINLGLFGLWMVFIISNINVLIYIDQKDMLW
jgi:hypothetical protein